jgi:hypothetical protein
VVGVLDGHLAIDRVLVGLDGIVRRIAQRHDAAEGVEVIVIGGVAVGDPKEIYNLRFAIVDLWQIGPRYTSRKLRCGNEARIAYCVLRIVCRFCRITHHPRRKTNCAASWHRRQ